MKTKKLLYLIQAVIFILLITFSSCKPKEESFTFAFMTDIHVQPEGVATEGFSNAIEKINELEPDFVIAGGDLIMDALGQTYGRADSLYKLYQEMSGNFNMPVYNTMGNHEVFGLYEESGVDSTHEFYGEKLFEKFLGKRYYAFNHKGWRFYILDSVDEHPDGGYYGHISQDQIDWLSEDLKLVDKETPIVLIVHIPFITIQNMINKGSYTPNTKGNTIKNSKQVLDLFQEHNLKLALQGHLHVLEDMYTRDVHYITSGAVSARWWAGPYYGTGEGFLLITVKGDNFEWEYMDYGWHAPVVKDELSDE